MPTERTFFLIREMKTLDVTKTHAGIVVLTGFGGKAWDTAYYLNGKLYAEGREDPSDSEALAKLCRKLAKDAGYAWSERLTHIWWRLSNHSDVPKTLAVYDAKTVKAYQTLGPSSFDEMHVWVAQRASDEMYMVSEAYELSGGAEGQFEGWYRDYLEKTGSFNSIHDDKLARYARMRPETPKAEFETCHGELATLMRAYLADVYRAPKPMDAVAKRAYRNMEI
jgi:hypothetical protein